MQARCIFDWSRELPGFDEFLRCRTKALRESGRDYAECAMGKNTVPEAPGLLACTAPDSVQGLLAGSGCEAAFDCADGTFARQGRCDFKLDCSNGDDERGCGHFICGDKLIDPGLACGGQSCPVTFTPPLCPPDNPLLFLCGDGADTHILNLCNGVKDCAERQGRGVLLLT